MAQGSLRHEAAEPKHGKAAVLQLRQAALGRVHLERIEAVVS